jgi:hypothetical protein
MNRMLAEEGETNARLVRKFNEYEAVQGKALSERDREIALLKEENRAVKGQRNTFLAILVTAGVVVVLFILFKVLRAVKIIPI